MRRFHHDLGVGHDGNALIDRQLGRDAEGIEIDIATIEVIASSTAAGRQAGQTSRTLYLPKGEAWTHVWSGRSYSGGQGVTVEAPIGQPPVFYRTGAEFAELFAGIRSL
jgi:hypothetical protein